MIEKYRSLWRLSPFLGLLETSPWPDLFSIELPGTSPKPPSVRVNGGETIFLRMSSYGGGAEEQRQHKCRSDSSSGGNLRQKCGKDESSETHLTQSFRQHNLSGNTIFPATAYFRFFFFFSIFGINLIIKAYIGRDALAQKGWPFDVAVNI